MFQNTTRQDLHVIRSCISFFILRLFLQLYHKSCHNVEMSKVFQFKDGGEVRTVDEEVCVRMGGMATPFGIRIYSSFAHSGASNWYIFLTGMIISIVFFSFDFLVEYFCSVMNTTADNQLRSTIGTWVYFCAFRFTPIASIHASEHKVIHAVESGVPLTIDNVQKQNRIHERCGTNVFAMITVLFSCTYLINLCPVADWLKFILVSLSVMLAAATHMNIGSFLQKHLTTKESSDRECENAIDVALEHNTKLVQYIMEKRRPHELKLFGMAVYNSGMLHIAGGYIVAINLLHICFPS